MVKNVYEHARARQNDLAYVKELTFAVILHREVPAAICRLYSLRLIKKKINSKKAKSENVPVVPD
jgi:hypothetical protein